MHIIRRYRPHDDDQYLVLSPTYSGKPAVYWTLDIDNCELFEDLAEARETMRRFRLSADQGVKPVRISL
jgi:hypothetical protein